MSDFGVFRLLHTGVRHVAVQRVAPALDDLLRLLVSLDDGPLGAGDGGGQTCIDH